MSWRTWLGGTCLMVAMIVVATWIKNEPGWWAGFAYAFPSAFLTLVGVALVRR